jgi:carboxyl-terminal processing protease
MPWDEIKPAVYPHATQIQSVLPMLVDKHRERIAGNPDFEYLRELMRKGDENNKKTDVSLNEATRIREKQDDDTWRLGLENKLRGAKGEPLLKSIAELDAKLDAEEAEEDAAIDGTKKTPEDDAMIREGAFVLIDYVNQTRQLATIVEPKPNNIVQ